MNRRMVAPTNGTTTMLSDRSVLLIISGGIAAYKSLDLIRRLRDRGARVRCVMTPAAAEFVTPLAVASLSGERVYTDLFSLTDESEMGHIRLSRESDLVVVAPASADLLARMAAGIANDLATTVLLATDKPVLAAPAMNTWMWGHAAVRRNVARLLADGVAMVGPEAGDLACGEVGSGRMSEPEAIAGAIERLLDGGENRPLSGRHVLVTSGPTREPVDPVRYVGNRSSGKQGHAVAAACLDLGARVTLVSGPVALEDPPGAEVVRVETACDMMRACLDALPADIAVCAAAVADWRVANATAEKWKKDAVTAPRIELVENPDILASLAAPGNRRPHLVVGFAAETGDVVERARSKLGAKNCDWIVANDVAEGTDTFGSDDNRVHLVSPERTESWPRMAKIQVARRLAGRIAEHFGA